MSIGSFICWQFPMCIGSFICWQFLMHIGSFICRQFPMCIGSFLVIMDKHKYLIFLVNTNCTKHKYVVFLVSISHCISVAFLQHASQTTAPSPELHHLTTVWDWKSWLTNHMHGMTGQSEPHVFHFFHDSTGKSGTRDKAYHTQGEWSEPYQLLTSTPQCAHHPFTCATMTALSFPPHQTLHTSSPYNPFHLKSSLTSLTTVMHLLRAGGDRGLEEQLYWQDDG